MARTKHTSASCNIVVLSQLLPMRPADVQLAGGECEQGAMLTSFSNFSVLERSFGGPDIPACVRWRSCVTHGRIAWLEIRSKLYC